MSDMSSGHKAHSAGQKWAMRVGIEIAASTMMGLGAGYFIDQWLDTRPWFLILFALFGMVAGFINLYHVMVVDQKGPGEPS